ncbi:DUF6691 family protein [Massilia sp. TS11]|uniref:DUF6691 family protein n=1 Tax=Massilia sp. TS11 TaxID=2908003 RepID=UPI001EDB7CDB|nr:DUF6691 family protein [Massilia sp. TS11]MCG2583058.1 YeeE/YedE family protein [Massilia sp. TS11]
MPLVFSFFCGLLFCLGLLISGMSNPAKVLAFLDLGGRWDPSLAMVMGGAITVATLAFALARRRSRSWLGDPIELPNNKTVDRRLVAGGLLFGVGWGLAGLCPGPALVGTSNGVALIVLFFLAMLLGMWLHDRFMTGWLK